MDIDLSIVKQEEDSSPLTFGGSSGSGIRKPAPFGGGGSQKVPEKYYWAPSPVSVKTKEPGHICGGSKDEPLDPFSTDYVEFTCCPPSQILEDYDHDDSNPIGINPFHKPQPVEKECLKTYATGNSEKRPAEELLPSPPLSPRRQLPQPSHFSYDVNSEKNPVTFANRQWVISGKKVKIERSVRKGCLNDNAKNEDVPEDMASPHSDSLSPPLEDKIKKTTKSVYKYKETTTFQMYPLHLENFPLKTDDTAIKTTTNYEDKTPKSILPPTHPSQSTPAKMESLTENFVNLTHEQQHLIPEKGVDVAVATREASDFFCSLCQRSYLTKTSYDWHVSRHKKCKECGVDLKQVRILSSGFSSSLEEYCVPCAQKVKGGFNVYIPSSLKKSIAKKRDQEKSEAKDGDGNGDVEASGDRRPGRPRKTKTKEDFVYGGTKGFGGLCGTPPRMKFTCERCGLGFMEKETFKVHLSQFRCHIVKGLGDIYKCNQCEKTYDSRNDLIRHMKMHQDLISRCPICRKWFRLEKHLAMHMTSHYSSGEFKCGVCKKQFGSITNLKHHQRLSLACSQGLLKLKEN